MTKELTNWKDEMAKSAKAVAEQHTAPVSGISLKSGVMSYNGEPVPGNKLECIILTSVFENTYFPGRYDPDKIVPPACYSKSVHKEGMVPYENVLDQQGDACATCANSQWGSDPNGGKGKACKEKVKLAIIPAGLDSTQVATAEVAIMTIPVTSVRNWGNYTNLLAAKYARPSWGISSFISVKPDAKTQFKVNFEEGVPLADDMLGAVHDRIAKATEALLDGYDYPDEEEDKKPSKARKF
jgi:hypothetical protein